MKLKGFVAGVATLLALGMGVFSGSQQVKATAYEKTPTYLRGTWKSSKHDVYKVRKYTVAEGHYIHNKYHQDIIYRPGILLVGKKNSHGYRWVGARGSDAGTLMKRVNHNGKAAILTADPGIGLGGHKMIFTYFYKVK